MEITEETRCWLCGRSPKELKKLVEDLVQSGSIPEDMGLDACFEVIEVGSSDQPIELPLCTICGGLILGFLERMIGGDPAEILTTADLKKFRITYDS